MKSCIEWREGFKYLKEIDQFNIVFRNKKEKLMQFLDIFATTQRVNLYTMSFLITENQIDLLIALYKTGKYNIAICFNERCGGFVEKIDKFKDAGVPFYFSYPIDNWDQLIGYCQMGVSDVFITGELGFDLERAAAVIHQKGIQIRCYPNICQTKWNNYKTGLTSFFIRPEDLYLYDEYIDVIQFDLTLDNMYQQNVYYEVYFHDKKWDGNLQNIIKGLKVPIHNYYLLGNEFGRRRINCQKRCQKGKRCNLCEDLKLLADEIEKSDTLQIYERRRDNG